MRSVFIMTLFLGLPLVASAEDAKIETDARARLMAHQEECNAVEAALSKTSTELGSCMRKTGGKDVVTNRVCGELISKKNSLKGELSRCKMKEELLFK